MATSAETRLRQFYARFGEHRFADLLEFFAPGVWYIQINSMTADNSPQGPEAVGRAYADWGRWFQNFQIGQPILDRAGQQEVERVGGAEACFTALYALRGMYVIPIPGLRAVKPPKLGRTPTLVMSDKVWLDGEHNILRVVNSFGRP